jgi:sugar O-acyltransferase (sialic acid O-acetyltransferase NeuD family)
MHASSFCGIPAARPSAAQRRSRGHHGAVELWIAGAGGVGREVLDVALALDVAVHGFLDDAADRGPVRGVPVRPLDALADGGAYLVAIGDPTARLGVAARLEGAGGRAVALVHPTAVVAPETTVGPGVLVMALAHVSSSVDLGAHVQVHYGSTVGHDCTLEEGATVLPGANVAGTVHLGRGATVGSGAIVLQGLTVGTGAVVGAGAVVTRDVEDGAVVVGNPAKRLER